MFGMLLLTSTSTFSQGVQIRVIDGDSLVVMPIQRLITANILFAQCDSIAADNVILIELTTNCSQLVIEQGHSITDLKQLVTKWNRLNELEKEKNRYFKDMIEVERKKRVRQGFIAGGLIILALLI
jgi:uncharacterized membrane protein YukC